MKSAKQTKQHTTSPQPSTTKKPGTKRIQKLEERKMTGPQMERMLKIHHQLQANCFPNAVSLKPLLEVGKKTIRRDVFYMQSKLKLPIAYDYSRKGWYYTKEVLYFPTQIVTESDLHLIAILEQTIGQFSGGEIAKRIQNLLNEFTRALPKSLKQARANWHKVVSIRFPNKAKYNPQHLDFLAQAAASELQVTLKYRKPRQAEYEQRVMNPYHLFAMNGDWYLIAHDFKGNKVQRFSLTRMEDLELTGQKFKRPADFDVDEFLSKSFGLQSADGDYNIILRVKPRLADFMHEREWNGLKEIRTLDDGSVEMHLNLSSLLEIQRWIANWGGGIRVVEPKQLRQMVAESSLATHRDNLEED